MSSDHAAYFAAGVIFAALVAVLGAWVGGQLTGRRIRDVSSWIGEHAQVTALVVFAVLNETVGVVALFSGHDGAATTALIVAGVALVFLVYLGPRLESLKFGSLELVLRDIVKTVESAEARGDQETADALRSSIPQVLNYWSTRVGPANEQSMLLALDVLLPALLPDDVRIRHQMALRFNTPNRRWQSDIALERGTDRVVIELVSASGRGSRDRVRRIAEDLSRHAPKNRLVVLAPDAEVPQLTEELAHLPNSTVLAWGSTKDTAGLRAVLEQVFGRR